MSEESPRYFKTLEEWRNWLKTNHDTESILWLVIQKKASNKPGIRYEEAVIEAVAYGWIDGKMKRIDDDEFKQRFTPRQSVSIWSKSNKERAQKLIAEGRMTPAGMKTIQEAKENGRWDKAYTSSRGATEIPDDLTEALKHNKVAKENFQSFPPSARFMYIHWINEAKKADTRIRRIKTVIYRSENNLRPGIDLRVIKE